MGDAKGAAAKSDPGAGTTATKTAEKAAPKDKTKDQKSTKTARAPKGEVRRQLLALLRASHPRQALALAVAVGVAAALSGRPLIQAVLAALAVAVTQAIAGLDNDIADAHRDRLIDAESKPIAAGLLPAGNASFVALCLFLIAIPLSLQHGLGAGLALLLCVPVAWVSNHVLRKSALSFLPWAVSAGLLVTFVAEGGWGAAGAGGAPSAAIIAFAALTGIGVHFLLALPDLVADNKSGVRHLPLRLALKVGAPRLLLASGALTAVGVIGMLWVAATTGLRQ